MIAADLFAVELTRPQVLSRRQKKHRTRHRANCRQGLLWMAGHACRHRIDESRWREVRQKVRDWELDAPLQVPRSLRKHLGKTVGGPCYRMAAVIGGISYAAELYRRMVAL